MSNNYPIKRNNQHEYSKFLYKEYFDISDEAFIGDPSSDTFMDVEIEMAGSIHDMRRDFKKTVKKLRKLYKDKAPKKPAYEYEAAKYARIRLARSHSVG